MKVKIRGFSLTEVKSLSSAAFTAAWSHSVHTFLSSKDLVNNLYNLLPLHCTPKEIRTEPHTLEELSSISQETLTQAQCGSIRLQQHVIDEIIDRQTEDHLSLELQKIMNLQTRPIPHIHMR